MKRALIWLSAILAVAAFCWFFPPFHIVPLGQARQKGHPAAFDAPAFATDFWQKKLLPATGSAIQATQLLAALAENPQQARQRLGRSPGLSSTTYFFIQGSGQITAIQNDRIRITLHHAAPQTTVELLTGFLFGNCVRDASGLLNVSDFPNSQDFNNISTELNRKVETAVIPALRAGAALGRTIRFAGCVELEQDPAPEPLPIVPVKIEWP